MCHFCNALRGLWERSYEKEGVSEWHKQFKESSQSQMKKMLNTFVDIKGVVHYEFVP
jgi:uncharacterized protein YktA (UPF0223 family)